MDVDAFAFEPGVVEPLHQLPSMPFGFVLEGRLPRDRRRPGGSEDPVPVHVLRERVERYRAVAGPDPQDRELPVERNERLEEARDLAQPPPGVRRVVDGSEMNLSLSVVAEPAGLQEAGDPDDVERLLELLGGCDRGGRPGRKTRLL